MKRIISCLLIFSTICASFASFSEVSAADTLHEIVGGIFAYNQAAARTGSIQEFTDEFLTGNAGTYADWYVISLVQAGINVRLDEYVWALTKYVDEKDIASATTRQRIALTFLACGVKNSYISETIANCTGTQGIMSLIYGLHLLNNNLTSEEFTCNSVAADILTMQNEDGGWKVTGTRSDADVTAMALQALAPLYNTDDSVHSAVDRALDLLSRMQLEDGSYQSFGVVNPESCAQVITALSALGIDCCTDERYIKNGRSAVDAMLCFRNEDGSFSHKNDGVVNQTATIQALYSLIALQRFYEGKGSLYDFTDISENQVKPELFSGYKSIACAVTIALFLVSCILLLVKGKKQKGNFVFAGLVTAILITTILVTDFQSVEMYYGKTEPRGEINGYVTISIDCFVLEDNPYPAYVPETGIILSQTTIGIANGDSVYDVLVEACRLYSIQMENSGVSEAFAYIAGINYLYEFEYGDLSGWIYTVNGDTPSVGCGEYMLQNGDEIRWRYTENLGNDLD